MKAYKGFNEDMTCRGFQFEEGKTYEEPSAKLCESGFHACEMPIDCLSYYPPSCSVYHEVELDEVSDERRDDSKVCGKKIKIGARLSIRNLVEAQIEYVKERTHEEEGGYATDKNGAASATGYQGAASATGDQGAASATGDQVAASATGNYGAASATGKDSVAMACGYQGKARAAMGCAIFLVERGLWNGKNQIFAVNAAIVDGEKIKPMVWYTLRNGEIVEAR